LGLTLQFRQTGNRKTFATTRINKKKERVPAIISNALSFQPWRCILFLMNKKEGKATAKKSRA